MVTKEKEISENVKSLLEAVHNKDSTNNDNSIETLDKLELAKIIVTELLAGHNIKSLSLLNQEQIEDITNAYLLNEYYQIDDIEQYILNYLTLKRSTSGYLIDKLTSMSMNNNDNEDIQQQNLFSRVFRR